MTRKLEDYIGAGIVLVIALTVALSLGSCEEVNASEIVYQTIAMEGANQSLEGQAMIASTLLNRALIRHSTPEIEAKRPKQYSCWNDPKWARAWLDKHYTPKTRQNAEKAYKTALVGSGINHFTHYHRVDILPYWAVGQRGVRHGDHVFYADIP